MKEYKYFGMNEAEALIQSLNAHECENKYEVQDLRLYIKSCSLSSLTLVLEQRKFQTIDLRISCFVDPQESESDFTQKLTMFANALRTQEWLKDFSFIWLKNSSNDLIVSQICQGLRPDLSQNLSQSFLQSVSLHGLVSDEGAIMVADLAKLRQLSDIDLSRNKISDKGAAAIIEYLYDKDRNSDVRIDLGSNQITDQTVELLLSGHADTIINGRVEICINLNPITLSAKKHLVNHFSNLVFRNRKKNFRDALSIFKVSLRVYKDRRMSAAAIDFLSSHPDHKYENEQKFKVKFEQNKTSEMSLEQLIKHDSRIWKKPIDNKIESISYKQIVVCAWSAALFNSLLANCEKFFYWQGDPHQLGEKYDKNKFTPAIAQNVEDLLEKTYPEKQFWVIDEYVLNKILHDFFIKDEFEFWYSAGRFLLNFPRKEVDLSFYSFWMTDALLNKIALGLSPTTTEIKLQGCQQLSPQTIRQVLQKHTQLRYLGLLDAKSWGVSELETLVDHCPYLQTLQICIDTAAPLNILGKFKCLKSLYLDFSYNLEIQDLNFLQNFGKHITLLNLSECSNLKNLNGLKFCDNLKEIWFQNMEILHFADLIVNLSRLRKLKLLVLHQCRYELLNDQVIDLIKTRLPEVFISVNKSSSDCPPQGENLSKEDFIKDEKLTNDIKTQSTNRVEALSCAHSPSDPAKRQCNVSQIFWDHEGKWPDHQLDRLSVLDHIEIKKDGHILFSAPLPLCTSNKSDFEPFPNVKVIPYKGIDAKLLQNYKASDPDIQYYRRNYYAGELEITVYTDKFTPIPSRGVFNIPAACSEKLQWVCRLSTGELFVSLPQQKTQQRTQKLRLRYVIAADRLTDLRKMGDTQSLPKIISDAFSVLSKNGKILEKFPNFKQLITRLDLSLNALERYQCIKGYCQMDTKGGFTDEPLDAEKSSIVSDFIDSLAIENSNTVLDLFSLFDTLLQQKGVCTDIVRCVKLLCDKYNNMPCHIILSKSHAFIDRDLYGMTKELRVTISDDLGGGKAQITLHPLKSLSAEEKYSNEMQDQIPLKSHKELCIQRALDELKPFAQLGALCKDLDEYVKLLLSMSCSNPLIYCDNPSDADKIVAAISRYTKNLFYINDPEQITSLWDSTHIVDNKPNLVPGWLQHFLRNPNPKVLVIDFKGFSRYDLASVQGIGDEHRTLNALSVQNTVLIGVAPKNLAYEAIFLSRFIAVVFREDLLANIQPIHAVTPLPNEEKINVPWEHLYHDPYLAMDSVSKVALKGEHLECVLGPLGKAVEEKKDIAFTEIPAEFQHWLSLAALTQQIPINGEPRGFPPIKIYSGKHPQPDNKNIRFVDADEMKAAKSHYYLNNHHYSRLVVGERHIDPSTGFSDPVSALLLTEELLEVIVLTHSLSYSNWRRLLDAINQQNKSISLYLCPGAKISGTEYDAPIEACQKTKLQSLPSCYVIESDAPEQTLSKMLEKKELSAEDVLTLTEDVGLELLEMINRKGDEGFKLDYKLGWLLSRFFDRKTTVLMADYISAELWDALESAFSLKPYFYTNEGRKDIEKSSKVGKIVLIKSGNPTKPLASTVVCISADEKKIEQKAAKTQESILSYHDRVQQLSQFLTEPNSIFFEWMGPPGAGKTTGVVKAIKALRKEGQTVEHFSSVEDYVAWRDRHSTDQKSLCVLQLDDCRRWPAGRLEYLRDLNRSRQFYWKGRWYPSPKVVMTNNPESASDPNKHRLFQDLQIPSTYCPALTREELAEYVVQPLLQEIKGIAKHTHILCELILSTYDHVKKALPNACISARQLTTICQRLLVLLSISTTENPLQTCAHACYEEFFGLFSQENQRRILWNEINYHTKLYMTKNPIIVDEKLKASIEKRDLQLTEQSIQMMSVIQRLVQMRNQYGEQKDFPGQCGLLLEGSPGILKTELSIAVLETLGFTPAPEIPDNKPHYLNLVAGDPYLMEQKLWEAYQRGWIVVCNELNLLKSSTIQLLMKLLDMPKTGFCLIGTQNPTSAGSGRKALGPALKNRLQVVYLQDYSRDELIQFARNQGLAREAPLLVDLYQSLRMYQQLHELPLSNPRHYFQWLKQLQPLKRRERSLSVMIAHLLQRGCNPPLSVQQQYHAAKSIMWRVPDIHFPKFIITENSSASLLPSPSRTISKKAPESTAQKSCLIM